MSLVYTRTIKTPAGPVLLEVEDLPGRYMVNYQYSYKAASGRTFYRNVAVAKEQIAYDRRIVEHVERDALLDLGRQLFREV